MPKYLKEAKPRPKEDLSQVRDTVSEILESVRGFHDIAVPRTFRTGCDDRIRAGDLDEPVRLEQRIAGPAQR